MKLPPGDAAASVARPAVEEEVLAAFRDLEP